MSTPPRDHVGSLERGLAVLEILARQPAGMTLTEMAEEGGLTRAGARRFLLTLVATGYATQDGKKFLLSARLLSVARTWLDAGSLWAFAEPIMREVATELDESCSAAVLSGEDVVYVARIAGRRIMRVSLQVGTRLPAYCTSMGRMLLAGLDPEALAAFLAHADIQAHTSKTLTDPAALTKAIRQAAEQNYAIVDEELEIGLRSIAVPIRDRAGEIIAAINVSVQSGRFTVAELRRVVLPPLQRAAIQIQGYAIAP